MTMEQRRKLQIQSIVPEPCTLEQPPSQSKKRRLSTRLNVDQDEVMAHALLNLSKCYSSNNITQSALKNHQHALHNVKSSTVSNDRCKTLAFNKNDTKCATISDDEDEEDEENNIVPPPFKRRHIMHYIAGVPCSSTGSERKLSPLPPPGKPIRAAPQFPRCVPERLGQNTTDSEVSHFSQARQPSLKKNLSIKHDTSPLWKVLDELTQAGKSAPTEPRFPRIVPEETALCS